MYIYRPTLWRGLLTFYYQYAIQLRPLAGMGSAIVSAALLAQLHFSALPPFARMRECAANLRIAVRGAFWRTHDFGPVRRTNDTWFAVVSLRDVQEARPSSPPSKPTGTRHWPASSTASASAPTRWRRGRSAGPEAR